MVVACTDPSTKPEARSTPPASAGPAAKAPFPTVSPPRKNGAIAKRPAWLGERVLPLRPDGFGRVRPTPTVLRNRRLPTIDQLPPPEMHRFTAAVANVPRAVAARSTWERDCPVALKELRYVRLSFWGFDRDVHTGELLVHRSVARDLVGVFRRLYRARFPIEEMRVVAPEELDAPPTGDGNNTTAFVCRPARGSESFSEHAYGLALDLNPFHNPYVKGDLVLPELASAYTNRDWRRPGMIFERSPAVAAFDGIGWGWGGRWNSLVDYMHFSVTGR
jgi:hypothetical protein